MIQCMEVGVLRQHGAVADRCRRRLAGRLPFACLPTPANLADFDVDAAAGIDRCLIDELGTCRYQESATNILLIGPAPDAAARADARAMASPLVGSQPWNPAA
jgi:hypothetical protein